MGAIKDKIKGNAKQLVGRATGNRRMEAEGVALRGRGALRAAGKRAKSIVKESTR